MRVNQGEYGAVPECKSGGNGRTPRKPADQRHRLERFPHAKIHNRHHINSTSYKNATEQVQSPSEEFSCHCEVTRRSGFNPRPDHSGFSNMGIVPDDGRFSRGFPVCTAFSFRPCSILTSFTIFGSQDIYVKDHSCGRPYGEFRAGVRRVPRRRGGGTQAFTLINSVFVTSLSFTVYCDFCKGLVTNFAMKEFSCRQVAVTGCLIALTGNILVIFATSVNYMVVTYGVVQAGAAGAEPGATIAPDLYTAVPTLRSFPPEFVSTNSGSASRGRPAPRISSPLANPWLTFYIHCALHKKRFHNRVGCHVAPSSDFRAMLHPFNSCPPIFSYSVVAYVDFHKPSHMKHGFATRNDVLKQLEPFPGEGKFPAPFILFPLPLTLMHLPCVKFSHMESRFVPNLSTVNLDGVQKRKRIVTEEGTLAGVGFGLMITPSFTAFNTYFIRRRNFAMGLSQIVIGMGCMVYPLFINALYDKYGFRGTQVIPKNPPYMHSCRNRVAGLVEASTRDLMGKFYRGIQALVHLYLYEAEEHIMKVDREHSYRKVGSNHEWTLCDTRTMQAVLTALGLHALPSMMTYQPVSWHMPARRGSLLLSAQDKVKPAAETVVDCGQESADLEKVVGNHDQEEANKLLDQEQQSPTGHDEQVSSHRLPPQRQNKLIPVGVAARFSHVRIVLVDAAGQQVFSGISRLTHPYTQELLHTHLASFSLALKTSLLRATKTSPLHSQDPDVKNSPNISTPL
ncbi:hypothetical protein PR048_027507 [Dryococelus australis]|uniref:Uncharacterized protein n=1 Tax=Dryococelus australis TaxID=614101 RepID=A0ABQ9GGQ4_9NEOP|nr:hypothetical protein PR048_027507 [Dryococelus australis]